MLCYLAFLIWLSSAIYYSKSPKIIQNCPNVSIAVAAHNEEKNLPLLLEALVNQNYEDYWLSKEVKIINKNKNK